MKPLSSKQTTHTKGNRFSAAAAAPSATQFVAGLSLVGLVWAISAAAAAAAAAAQQLENNNNNNNDNFYYTRLRFDQNYLPIYKNLQEQYPRKEIRVPLGPEWDNRELYDELKERKYYYENPQIKLPELSENDLILESLDQVYKSRLMQSYEHSFDNPLDRKRASDPNKVSAKRCQQELDYLMGKSEQLFEQRSRHNKVGDGGGQFRGLSPELATFFDSYANQESGVLVGNVFWLGNWLQCSKRHIFDPSARVSFTGRYCIASIRSEQWLAKIEHKVRELKSRDYFRYPSQEFNYRQHFRIQLGICLPESCDSTIIDKRLHDIERLTLRKLLQPFNAYNLTDLYCLPDESSPLREISLSGKLLIAFGLVWLLTIMLSTWADVCDLVGLQRATMEANHAKASANAQTNLQRIVVSMSLVRNYNHLMYIKPKRAAAASSPPPAKLKQNGLPNSKSSVKYHEIQECNNDKQAPSSSSSSSSTKPSPADLYFLDAFKAIAMLIILLGHIGMITLQLCQYQLDFHTVGSIYFHFMASTAFYVDWFFCITGFIIAYGSFATKSVHSNTALHWLYSIFHRYWRLAPIYVLTFWFCRTLFQHTSSGGPMWDYATSNTSLRSICQQESWLVPLTLTSNWQPLHRECIMPAWYIANDMQFYLVTPVLLLLLARRPTWGWLSLIGLSALSVLERARAYGRNPRAQHLELLHPRYDLVMRNNWDLHQIYLEPQYRISPYLIGLLAGHYAYMVRSHQWRSPFVEAPPSPSSASSSSSVQAKAAKWPSPTQPPPPPPSASSQWRPASKRALLAWLGLSVTCSMSMTSWLMDAYLPAWVEPIAKPVCVLIYSIGHTLAGLGIAALFLAMVLGHWPRVRRLMELPIWTLLARINFFVYLFQVEAIVWANQAGNKLPETSAYEQFRLLLALVPVLYGLSWLVTLLIASPLAQLEHQFVGVYMRRAPGGGSPPVPPSPPSHKERRPSSSSSGNNGAHRGPIGREAAPAAAVDGSRESHSTSKFGNQKLNSPNANNAGQKCIH